MIEEKKSSELSEEMLSDVAGGQLGEACGVNSSCFANISANACNSENANYYIDMVHLSGNSINKEVSSGLINNSIYQVNSNAVRNTNSVIATQRKGIAKLRSIFQKGKKNKSSVR